MPKKTKRYPQNSDLALGFFGFFWFFLVFGNCQIGIGFFWFFLGFFGFFWFSDDQLALVFFGFFWFFLGFFGFWKLSNWHWFFWFFNFWDFFVLTVIFCHCKYTPISFSLNATHITVTFCQF